MASSSVWDMTEAAVAIIGRLPLILQTAGVLIAAQAVVSNAGNILILKSSLVSAVGKGFLSGLNPFS
ncbi:MAG: hypothetical protein GOV00_04170 [Candidatus Altiarchaeota archaeon]|nr:hypothetical protein [Candidatus Altiarchaeota archaeon]